MELLIVIATPYLITAQVVLLEVRLEVLQGLLTPWGITIY